MIVDDIYLELAVFVFIMLAIGIGLTIHEFRAHVLDHEEEKHLKKTPHK